MNIARHAIMPMFVSPLCPCVVKISHTAGFISLMEHFTPPTMRGEGDRKNDPTYLNTLKYNPNIRSPILRVVRVVRVVTVVPSMSVLWREYRVGAG